MPAEIVMQRRTPQVLGPNRIVDAVEVGALTIPSGVYFERVVTYMLWNSGLSRELGIMGPIADNIESILTQEMVVSATGVEDLDANGLVRKMVEFTVQYVPTDPGQTTDQTMTVTVPVERLGTPEGRAVLQGQLNHAHDQLAAVAAAG